VTRYLCYASSTVVSDSLFGDVAAALREHGSATLDEHCCYFLRPGCVLVGGHRDLRSLGITDCPVTAMTVTRCDGRDITGVRYPPICSVLHYVFTVGVGLITVFLAFMSIRSRTTLAGAGGSARPGARC
jgi:hypothetical protein